MTELQRGFTYFGLSSLIASSDHPSCLMIHDYRLIWAIRILQKGQPTPTNPQSNTSSSSIISGFFPQQRFCILLPHQSHYYSPYVVPALSEPGQLCLRWAGPNFVDNRASSSILTPQVLYLVFVIVSVSPIRTATPYWSRNPAGAALQPFSNIHIGALH